MRSAETAARGAIIVTIVAIITADMISERYVMNATSDPTDMPPLSMRCAPNQITEMLAEMVLAKNLEATEDEIIAAMHPHPTMSEAIMEAAGVALGKAIHL